MSDYHSIVAQKIWSHAEKFSGLNDHHIAAIKIFLTDVFGFKNHKIVVDYKSKPKRIIICIMDDAGKSVFIRPKTDIIGYMSEFLGLDDRWAIVLEDREIHDYITAND